MSVFEGTTQRFAFADLPYGHCDAGAGVDSAWEQKKNSKPEKYSKILQNPQRPLHVLLSCRGL